MLSGLVGGNAGPGWSDLWYNMHLMKFFWLFATALLLATAVHASWYWPFGSDEDEPDKVRLSTLMAPATELIDEASDLAADGKVQESVDKYRKALEELDRIERENPERAQTQEFATIRNKRAYVNAAIDAMLLSQVRSNAKVVAVSDTTELERKLAEERKAKSGEAKKGESGEKGEKGEKGDAAVKAEVKEPVREAVAEKEERPAAGKDRIAYDIAHGDFEDASSVISLMLNDKPNDPVALNLKAAMESAQGKFKEAEATLDQAIMSNPRNHYAYYNMALLVLRLDPSRSSVAKRYYETGRTVGGPEDPELEGLLK